MCIESKCVIIKIIIRDETTCTIYNIPEPKGLRKFNIFNKNYSSRKKRKKKVKQMH